jgi:hypothetical protein
MSNELNLLIDDTEAVVNISAVRDEVLVLVSSPKVYDLNK